MTGEPGLPERVRRLVDAAASRYAGTPAEDALATTAARLDEPLRVALAGRVKAGKSTLLNALVGQELAATDAAECTRIVTWYQDGIGYRLMLYPRSGPPRQLPFARAGSSAGVDLGGLTPPDIDRLVVDWPSATLRDMTLIDTPGIGSVDTELSDHTVRHLAPEDEQPGAADAIVYLMRHVHGADVRFLEAFHDDPGRRGPVNTIGVLARADEIGHARPDALDAAERIAARYRRDPRVRRLCQTVIPVAGLLAASGATLRETEFRAFQQIASAPQSPWLLASADRFATAPAVVSPAPAERAALLERFGMFGVRLAIHLVGSGRCTGAAALSAALLDHSGLDRLRELLAARFAGRAQVLKARSALLAVAGVLRQFPGPGTDPLLRDLEEIRAGAHEFAEIALLDTLRAGLVGWPDADLDAAERLLGGAGTDERSRLDLDAAAPEDDVAAAARDALGRWQRRSEDLAMPREARDAARVLVRSCEGILANHTVRAG